MNERNRNLQLSTEYSKKQSPRNSPRQGYVNQMIRTNSQLTDL